MQKTEIEKLNHYYQKGLCTFSECYHKILDITTETNIDTIINFLRSSKLIDLFIIEFKKSNYPRNSQEWNRFKIGTTSIYNSKVSQKDINEKMEIEKDKLSKIIPLFRKKLSIQ